MKKKISLIIIGLLLILLPYFFNVYSILRLLGVLLGLIILEIGLIINKKDKAWRIVVFPIIFIAIAFALDYGSTHLFKRIPIFANEIKSSKKVITYESLFYREYSCNNKIIVDDLYKKNYQCGNNDLEEVDVTSYLNNILENYSNSKDKFVKLGGKISKLNGTYNLEMQAYTLTDDSANGYVLFSESSTLEVNFNQVIDLTNYKVYDSITVIGRVDELIKKGENYILKLFDSKILTSDLYETYELSANTKNSCERDLEEYAKTEELTYYKSCLEQIFVKYDDENVYDLSYVLLDKRLNFEALTKKSEEQIEENGNILYKFQDFNMLKCKDSEEVILGNKDLKIDSPYCEVEEPQTDEEL